MAVKLGFYQPPGFDAPFAAAEPESVGPATLTVNGVEFSLDDLFQAKHISDKVKSGLTLRGFDCATMTADAVAGLCLDLMFGGNEDVK